MFTPENFNLLMKEVMSRLGIQDNKNKKNTSGNNANSQPNKKPCLSLTPSQTLVIGGLLGGALEVTSVLIDKDQQVQIVLSGSLKRKTELEKMMDQIGALPFEDVMKAMLERFT